MKNTTVTGKFLFPVTTLYTPSLSPLSDSTASVTLPISLSATNRLSCSTMSVSNGFPKWKLTMRCKGGSTLVTLPSNVTSYRDSENGACDRVTNF